MSVLLLNPKTPANVAGALRSLSHMGDGIVYVTGDRITEALRQSRRSRSGAITKLARCPKDTPHLRFIRDADEAVAAADASPVVVEVSALARPLPDFEHPDRALYVFGPEDGGVPDSFLPDAPRVVIPARYCLNLSTSVGIVLYDRAAKSSQVEMSPPLQPGRPSRSAVAA